MLPTGTQWVVATPEMARTDLLGAEADAVARVVDARVAEFRAGRAAARAALAKLGVARYPIPVGPDRKPRWPAGFVGSISHCRGLCVVAVAPSTTLSAIGIDCEPADRLPPELVDVVTTPCERRRLEREMDGRVLFSAKEAFYKAWSASGGRFLEFADVEVHLGTGRFVAHPVDGGSWHGSWALHSGFVLTAAWAPA